MSLFLYEESDKIIKNHIEIVSPFLNIDSRFSSTIYF